MPRAHYYSFMAVLCHIYRHFAGNLLLIVWLSIALLLIIIQIENKSIAKTPSI